MRQTGYDMPLSGILPIEKGNVFVPLTLLRRPFVRARRSSGVASCVPPERTLLRPLVCPCTHGYQCP
jgi:hypothetical protein